MAVCRERRSVTGLLVPAVAPVLAVDDDVEPELTGDVDGLVTRHVVDEDDPTHDVVRNVRIRPLERPRGVVGGHHDDDQWCRCRIAARRSHGRTGGVGAFLDADPRAIEIVVGRHRARGYTRVPA